ncbi:HD domain-containing protein [Halobiforma nitratireducens]|uniref:Metal dependent phosphohydrolase n=1 Tax=Halobiforma nitratireducens JCM 10879 TaxID=1227454 RepID=M0MLD9_9EURY|nr:HD domain-containing protein [Halobiforma nitratireducens]EMA46476.1 metal dependent phosphohydrolase [Halobiforma nitratireducens JCM 10879]
MLDAVRRRARPYFADAQPAHDWRHVRRVEALAETLVDRHRRSVGASPLEVDERVLTLAVLLHDIGRAKEDRGEIDDHSTWGAREAERILEELEAEPTVVDRVRHCVDAHRYSAAPEPGTLEAKLLSDADNLDALGAVGIARVFSYGGEVGSPIHGLDVVPDDGSSPIEADDGGSQYDHIHEKLLDLPDRMYTDVGRELADARASFVREYVTQFDAEIRGDR